MSREKFAEVFPPGEYIDEEIQARGWSNSDFAEVIGKDSAFVSKLITGKRTITLETAQLLADAFGTSAEMWMNLETKYRLSLANHQDSEVKRRSELYGIAPVRHMVRRCWVSDPGRDVDQIEQCLKLFYGVQRVQNIAVRGIAARKSTSYGQHSESRLAWFRRCQQLAPAVQAKRFVKRGFENRLVELKGLCAAVADIRRVPKLLAKIGVRLIYVEHLPTTKIDGAAFWLNRTSPVVAMSLRHGRADYYWFTLCHELAHIVAGDEEVLDDELVGDSSCEDELPQHEKDADRFASNFLIPESEMVKFIARKRPNFSKKVIAQFALRIGVHPSIVVGQLQHRREIPYSHHRELLVQVREEAIGTALTDGWGNVPTLEK